MAREALWPLATLGIEHVTFWPATLQVPVPPTTCLIFSPAGTLSVNVIGWVLGPPLDTVDRSSARLPALVPGGPAVVVTPTSCIVTRFTARFIAKLALLVPVWSSLPLSVGAG